MHDNYAQHDQTPTPQTKVVSWLLAVSTGLLFWIVAGAFLVALVW